MGSERMEKVRWQVGARWRERQEGAKEGGATKEPSGDGGGWQREQIHVITSTISYATALQCRQAC